MIRMTISKNIFMILFLLQTYAAEVNSPAQPSSSSNQETINARLFEAIKEKNLDAVKAAFEAGAQVNAKNANESTPVMLAAAIGHEAIFRYLINDKRANFNAPKGDITPLLMAAYYGHLNLIKILMEEKQVKDNKITASGYTALYLAAEAGRLDIVTYLCERKEFNKDIDGVVAMALANNKQRQSIVDYLKGKGIPVIPKAGKVSGFKSIFYNESANTKITFDLLQALAYTTISIQTSSVISGMEQGGKLFMYQLKVVRQGQPNVSNISKQLEKAVQTLEGTKEMHYNANPIFGGTCAYHAVKNGLLGLMMLYDYDELVACTDTQQACTKNIEWVSEDIANLTTLNTKSFDCTSFMEQLHAKTFMIKSRQFGPLEPIDTKLGLDSQQKHIARHEIDNALVSIMENRYQASIGKYDNLFSFIDQDAINTIQSPFGIEVILSEHEVFHATTHPSPIQLIQAYDLLKQIVFFRTKQNHRQAFILSLNEGTLHGRGQSSSTDNTMHAITVIMDKRASTVNAIICESNNSPSYAIKHIVFDFISLIIDDKKCLLTAKQVNQLRAHSETTSGHWIENKEEGLPSFQSLVEAYEAALQTYKKTEQRGDLQDAFFLLSRIEYVYKQVQKRATQNHDEKEFTILKKILPVRLSKAHGLRDEEIILHNMMQELEAKELTDKLFNFIGRKELEKVKEILRIGANVNAKDRNGNTPLLQAIQTGNVTMIEYLYANNADLGASDGRGETALMLAVLNGHTDIIEYLINQRVNVNAQDNAGALLLWPLSVMEMIVIKN